MEIPKAPKNIVDALKRFDKRLDILFDPDERLWRVVEISHKTGKPQHVFYWHEGTWNDRGYRPLPLSANPILERLSKIDVLRYGPHKSIGALLRAGFSERRARAMERHRIDLRERLREYAHWVKRIGPENLMRRYRLGGYARRQAIRTRMEMNKEILGRMTPYGDVDLKDLK